MLEKNCTRRIRLNEEIPRIIENLQYKVDHSMARANLNEVDKYYRSIKNTYLKGLELIEIPPFQTHVRKLFKI